MWGWGECETAWLDCNPEDLGSQRGGDPGTVGGLHGAMQSIATSSVLLYFQIRHLLYVSYYHFLCLRLGILFRYFDAKTSNAAPKSIK